MKKPKAPRLVTVAIFTTITIIFWIFLSVYLILTKAPPIDVDPEILEPIDPTLDQQVFNDLRGRTYFEEGETSSPVVVVATPTTAPVPTPTAEEVEISTSSGTPTPVPFQP